VSSAAGSRRTGVAMMFDVDFDKCAPAMTWHIGSSTMRWVHAGGNHADSGAAPRMLAAVVIKTAVAAHPAGDRSLRISIAVDATLPLCFDAVMRAHRTCYRLVASSYRSSLPYCIAPAPRTANSLPGFSDGISAGGSR
jgi:hypothetical protein